MMKGQEEPADTKNHFHTVAILAVVALCYANALYCGFVFDDSSAIVNNKDLLPSTPIWNIFKNDFWGTPMHKEESHKSYRPLCVLTFRLNYVLHELDPVGYHLVNVILHGIVCVLVMRVCRHFFDDRPSFMAAVLFAVHPIHTEAVTGVVGRAELLSCLFSLIAFLSYAKSTRHHRQTDWGSLFMTILLVTIATLCKEQGITMVGICCCYEILVVQKLTVPKLINIMTSHKSRPNNNNSSATPTKTQRKKQSRFPPWLRASIIRISVLFIATMFLLFARMRIMGTQLPVFTRFDNPASVASFPTRHLTYWYLLPVNAWLLLCPSQLCCDWTMGTIPLVTSAIDPRNLATAAFVMIIIWLGCYAVFVEGKRSRQVAMSLCFLVLPFIPASNLFFPVGFVVAERVLYVPSIGYSMLFAVVYTILQQRNVSKFVLHFLVSTLLIVYATKTVTRNLDWESEYTLFQAGLKVTTNNAKLWNNVGHALEQEEKWQDALRYFQQATNVQTDDAGAWINVGRAFKHIGNFTEAEKAYEVAKNLLPPVIPGQKYVARVAPTHLSAYVNLANIIKMNTSRLQEADKLYRQVLSLRPDFVDAYINRAEVLLEMNRTKEAFALYTEALSQDDENADVHYNLGVVYLRQGKKHEAFPHLDRAIDLNPRHTQALFNYGAYVQEMQNEELRPLAITRLKKVVEAEPDHELAYYNLGMMAMDDHNMKDAEIWLKKSIEINPKSKQSLFNLALVYHEDKRIIEAKPYLEQLLKYHPTHNKSLLLLGDIHLNVLKDKQRAKEYFAKILETDPNHIQARHNLCVVLVEDNQWQEAEKCLYDVFLLAPQEDYIKKHLQIVRRQLEKIEQQMEKSKSDGNSKR
ncbi:protein O-mannosyl-transferase TMTC3-like [Amphiura filiformis]|uniref:protein O-mannosyl-transferase TMTC3-like n=1 Tax=Amphiura filiformis TaxID=82378 RepID=UPI003B21CF2D